MDLCVCVFLCVSTHVSCCVSSFPIPHHSTFKQFQRAWLSWIVQTSVWFLVVFIVYQTISLSHKYEPRNKTKRHKNSETEREKEKKSWFDSIVWSYLTYLFRCGCVRAFFQVVIELDSMQTTMTPVGWMVDFVLIEDALMRLYFELNVAY